MEDKKERGYPVYAEDELGGISSVASASDTTGLEPTPPVSKNEAKSYSELSNIPQQTKKVNNGLQQKNQNKLKF